MIKIDTEKGEMKVEGNAIRIYIETGRIVKELCGIIVDIHGKNTAKRLMTRMIEACFMDDEEICGALEKMREEKPETVKMAEELKKAGII